MKRSTIAGLGVLGVACAVLGWRALGPAAPLVPVAGPEARVVTAPAAHAPPPEAAATVVYVAGDVARPGVYRLGPGRRVVDAVRAAGEARPDADLVAVNLAEPLRDGEEVVVPPKGERPAVARRVRGVVRAPSRRGGRSRGGRKRASGADPAGAEPPAPIDLNAADAAELAELPGIGMGLAERIVAFRDANGPFNSVDELADVSGITDRRLEQVSPYLTVGGHP